MKKFILFILLLIPILSQAQWIELYPDSSLSAYPNFIISNNQNLFVGTSADGMKKTQNHQWITINNGLNSSTITAGYSINNLLLIGTIGGIYKSSNNGQIWYQTLFLDQQTFQINQYDNNKFILGNYGRGVYISVNNGESWVEANNGIANKNIWCVTGKKISTFNYSLFAGSYLNGIYYSSDGGNFWITKNNGIPSTELKIKNLILKDNIVFAATTGVGVYKSTNNGDYWYKSNTGIINQNYIDCYDLKVIGNKIFLYCNWGIYYSLDNADNWTKLNTPTTNISSIGIDSNYFYIGNPIYGIAAYPLSQIVGIQNNTELITESNIEIYPNPGNDNITIKYGLINRKDLEFLIYDINGKLIDYQTKKTISTSDNLFKYNVSNLPSGIYFIQVKTNDFIKTEKFIKLK
jgi:hypothetical protein